MARPGRAHTAGADPPDPAALLAGLRSRSAARRKAAAGTAGQVRLAAAEADLTALLTDADPDVVAAALWALGRIGASAQLPAITARLTHPNERVARAAAWAAAQIGGQAAVAALAAHLAVAPPDLVTPVLVALDHLPRSTAIAALLPLLHAGDGPARSRASQALLRWGGASAAAVAAHLGSALAPSAGPSPCLAPCRRACAYVLAATARPDHPGDGALLGALAADPDPRTRLHAVAGLRRLGDPAAHPVLVRLLDDERRDVQSAALTTLLAATPLADGVAAHLRLLAAQDRPHLRAPFASASGALPGAAPFPSSVRPTSGVALPATVTAALLARVVPGLEEIAAAELAALGAVVGPAWSMTGRLLAEWSGPLEPLRALRTIEDLLLDAGPLPELGAPASATALAEALALWERLTGLKASAAYVRLGLGVANRDALRTRAVAALHHLGISTDQPRASQRLPLTLEVLPVGSGPGPLANAYLGVRLWSPPLGKRPLAGGDVPASLNATVAAAMVRLLAPPGGDVFLDPLCGAGTLLHERVLALPAPALLLGGDIEPRAVARATISLAGTPARLAVWDATALPLDAAAADVIACNPPYGRRTGSHEANRALYPRLLAELHRVVRSGGRGAIVTAEKTLLERSLAVGGWQLLSSSDIVVGGLTPTICLIEKT